MVITGSGYPCYRNSSRCRRQEVKENVTGPLRHLFTDGKNNPVGSVVSVKNLAAGPVNMRAHFLGHFKVAQKTKTLAR